MSTRSAKRVIAVLSVCLLSSTASIRAATEEWQPLWSTMTLSTPRTSLAGAAVENKIVFAGGNTTSGLSNQVDIFDVTTRTWTTASLSEPRRFLQATTLGTKMFFGGGEKNGGTSDRVDIYDTATNTWSFTTMPTARQFHAAGAAVGKVLFGGGYSFATSTRLSSVDIYDVATNTWTSNNLTLAREYLAGATAGNKVVFGGGRWFDGSYHNSAVIDVYDATAGTWSTASLGAAREYVVGASVGNKAYLAGGFTSSRLDIFDGTTNAVSIGTSLSDPRAEVAWATVGNKLIFAGGTNNGTPRNSVDIYNPATGTRITSTISSARAQLAGAGAGRFALFAGGSTSGFNPTATVDAYRLQEYDAVTSVIPFTLRDNTKVFGDVQLNSGAALTLGGFDLSAASTTVSGGASLAGKGSIGGTIAVAGGSTAPTRGTIHLADASIGAVDLTNPDSSAVALTIGGAAAGETSFLDFDIGAFPDQIIVRDGKLVVNPGGGMITIVPRNGADNGVYNLITFDAGQASGLDRLSVVSSQPNVTAFLQYTPTSLQVVLSGLPEPGAIGLLSAAGMLLALRRQRRP